MIGHFGDIYAHLGSTQENINETLTQAVLEPWLQFANITGVGIEDFDYSSGKCNHLMVSFNVNLIKEFDFSSNYVGHNSRTCLHLMPLNIRTDWQPQPLYNPHSFELGQRCGVKWTITMLSQPLTATSGGCTGGEGE